MMIMSGLVYSYLQNCRQTVTRNASEPIYDFKGLMSYLRYLCCLCIVVSNTIFLCLSLSCVLCTMCYQYLCIVYS